MALSATKDETGAGLKNSAQNFRDNAASAAYEVKNDLRDGAHDVKNDLRDTANKVGNKVREFVDSTSDEMTHATKTMTSYIHEKPVQSTLIALGVGYILAALLRR